MKDQQLSHFIGKHTLGILGCYAQQTPDQTLDVYICGVEVISDQLLKLFFPKGHQLTFNQLVTLHLDNRSGVSEYDAELKVYRLSFKGVVSRTDPHHAIIEAREYQTFYGMGIEKEYVAQGYQYPTDLRDMSPLPITPLNELPEIDDDEHDNKIGVLLSHALQQPHTTVMAFLSTKEDDIFFITFKGTFKSKLLRRDNRCHFAIDSRATFTFEHAIEWNYSIIQGEVLSNPETTYNV
ncbi:hypothetical protein P4S72_21485 [Vibrio sp. PP-XX7]